MPGNTLNELARRSRQSLFEIYTRVLSEYGISQSRQGFSRHLVTLEEVGIIEVEWQGTTKLHTLNRQRLNDLMTHDWWKQFEEKT